MSPRSASAKVPALFHEISQPLTTMRCSLEISLLESADRNDQRQCIEQALKETDRVIQLLERLRRLLDA